MSKLVLLVITMCLLSSCASLTNRSLRIHSDPDEAEVIYKSTKGEKKVLGKTPLKIDKREVGMEETGEIEITKTGFPSSTVEITSELLEIDSIYVELKRTSPADLNSFSMEVEEIASLIKEKKYEVAQKKLQVLIKKYPRVSFLHELLGNTYYLQEKTEKAKESYTRAKRLSPSVRVDRMIKKLKDDAKEEDDEEVEVVKKPVKEKAKPAKEKPKVIKKDSKKK